MMLVQHDMPLAAEIDRLGPARSYPLTIHVPGEIRGKGRPKFTARGSFGRAYTDSKTANAETWVRSCAVDQVGQPVLTAALSLEVRIVVSVPRSWPKKRQMAALAGQERPTSKPDLDNTVKLIADALNGIVWKDDSQIADMRVSKRYGSEPGAFLAVFPILAGQP